MRPCRVALKGKLRALDHDEYSVATFIAVTEAVDFDDGLDTF